MRAGVSTACLYPKPLEESLYDLAVNGISCTEVFINTHSELQKSFTHEIKRILERFDIGCAAVHPFFNELEQFMFFSDYERRTLDSLEYCRLFFRFMNITGAEIFVLHSPKAVKSKDFFCERFSRIYRLGKEYGVTVAIENVSRCQSGSSVFIRDIAKMLGNEFSFVLDTKQAVRAGETPFKFLEAAGNKIAHVHISDSGEFGDCLPIGKGRFNFKLFFEKLCGLNPDCSVILELYRNNFSGIGELVSSYNTLCKMVGNFPRKGKEQHL